MTTQMTQAILDEARAAVETHQVGDRFPRTFNAVIELADQRDDLLAAMRKIATDCAYKQWADIARAAIAKAEGRS
jgi:hypothetical protein